MSDKAAGRMGSRPLLEHHRGELERLDGALNRLALLRELTERGAERLVAAGRE
jgi:hypothetical protein